MKPPTFAVLPLLVLALFGCQGDDDGPRISLSGAALAGPTCPVVTDPPDPACEDAPVVGATVLVFDADAREVARATTDAAGRFSVSLPPGSYSVVPQPVEGLMGTAEPIEVTLEVGDSPELLRFGYDTGIR